ncbi:MAG: DUF6491 family protein [Dokdonella sp.]
MFQLRVVAAFAAIGLMAAASMPVVFAQTREAQEQRLEHYLAGAGAPVEKFQFYKLQKWELVSPNQVVVWTRVTEAWLLTLEKPCSELEWTQSIALTSSTRQVRKRFDYVLVGKGRRCQITEIRPLSKDVS